MRCIASCRTIGIRNERPVLMSRRRNRNSFCVITYRTCILFFSFFRTGRIFQNRSVIPLMRCFGKLSGNGQIFFYFREILIPVGKDVMEIICGFFFGIFRNHRRSEIIHFLFGKNRLIPIQKSNIKLFYGNIYHKRQIVQSNRIKTGIGDGVTGTGECCGTGGIAQGFQFQNQYVPVFRQSFLIDKREFDLTGIVIGIHNHTAVACGRRRHRRCFGYRYNGRVISNGKITRRDFAFAAEHYFNLKFFIRSDRTPIGFHPEIRVIRRFGNIYRRQIHR